MARRREWQDFIFDQDVTSGADPFTGLLRGDINETKGMTLIRIILDLMIVPAAPGVASQSTQKIALGIGMFPEVAIASGASNLADPSQSEDKPLSGWMWRTHGVVGDDTEPGMPFMTIKEDIHSKRKVMYGSTGLRVRNSQLTNTAFTVTILGIIRCLYLKD